MAESFFFARVRNKVTAQYFSWLQLAAINPESFQRNGWEILGWTSLFGIMLAIGSYFLIRYFQVAVLRKEAEWLYHEKFSELEGTFDDIPSLMDRARVIRQASKDYSGTTARNVEAAIKDTDQLYLIAKSSKRVLSRIETLLFPENAFDRIRNRFSFTPYHDAVFLLKSKSIGFEDAKGRREILFSNSNQPDYQNLVGHEDAQVPFKNNFEEVLETFPVQHQKAAEQLDQVENGISELSTTIDCATEGLETLSTRLAHLLCESQRDGFFPLHGLQSKLIPSILALIEEAARLGPIDPISACQSSGKLACRQVEDGIAIVRCVEKIRHKDFPTVYQAVTSFQAFSRFPNWIDNVFIEHSENLESLCEYAILWPVTEHLETFLNQVNATMKQVSLGEKLGNSSRTKSLLLIESLEKEIANKRTRFAERLGVREDQILREGELDPSTSMKRARIYYQSMLESLSAGEVDSANSIHEELIRVTKETRIHLQIAEEIIDKGELAWNKIDTRLELARKRLPNHIQVLSSLKEQYHSDIFYLKEIFNLPALGIERIADQTDGVHQKLDRAETSLLHFHDAYADGQLLKCGQLVERASSEVRSAEYEIATLRFLQESIEKLNPSIEARHGEASFRHRSLQTKLSDRRTRATTQNSYQIISGKIAKLNSWLESDEKRNPFEASRLLDEIFQDIDTLENRIAIDWDWHEISTASIKSAARVIRESREFTGELEDFKHEVDQWFGFLEKDHCDWKLAYDAGVDLEIKSALRITPTDKTLSLHKAVQMMTQANHTIGQLMDWENPARVKVDRHAGCRHFEQARKRLAEGRLNSATANAETSLNDSATAMSLANALVRRNRIEQESQLRRKIESSLIDKQPEVLDPDWKLTASSVSPWKPLNAHHLFGFRTQLDKESWEFESHPADRPNILPFETIQNHPPLEDNPLSMKA